MSEQTATTSADLYVCADCGMRLGLYQVAYHIDGKTYCAACGYKRMPTSGEAPRPNYCPQCGHKLT